MSLSIGYKIFPTAESAKIRQNPNLIHYEGRLPTFGDRFKDTPAPPKSGNIGDTVGRYDNWVNQQKPKSSTVESGQHHQRQTESVVVTTTSKTVASSARHGSANSNVIHSMVSPDYETVMKDFDQHLNDSANSDRSSEYDVVHDSYDVHHSVETEPLKFETPHSAEVHHDYYEVPRESQYENFPPPPPQADYENLMDVRDSIEIIRESQANWPPMNEPQHESVKEFAATKNPYVFSTEDFTIEPERESHTHHKAEVHHDHTVSFDNHEEVIPPVEEVNRHSYQHREVVEDASERNSGASSEKSDAVPHVALIAELEKSFKQVGTSPAAVKEIQKSEESQREEEIRRRIEEIYRDYTPERFLDEIPTEENGIAVPEWKRMMAAKKLSHERAEQEEQRLLDELNGEKNPKWK